MKRFIYALILMLLPLVANAEVKVEASETVELMSVLSRLAGYDEFCKETNSYAQDIDKWFANYKNHATVSYFMQLPIRYDAVASMGIHLTIENGTLKYVSDRSLLDSRWKNVNLNEFLSKLNAFYKDSKFHDFYVAHEDYFAQAVSSYKNRVLPYFHQEWYSSFYGTEPNENFWVIISFNNGGHNYGPSRQAADGKRDVFNVCTYSPGQDDAYYVATILIHEFNHSFVNPLLDDNSSNAKLIQDAGEWLFKFSQQAMISGAYGSWESVINESVVRACMIFYMLNNDFTQTEVKSSLEDEISAGFTWTPDLVKKLKEYTEQRNKYKTLNDFYPEIAKCLNQYVSERKSAAEKNLSSKEDFVKSKSTQVKVEASETVELMSVLSRLAGIKEYCKETNSYASDIDKWFASYKNHAMVQYYQLLLPFGIAYDRVTNMGVHLTIENGTIKLIPNKSLLASEWSNVDLDEFLNKLNVFYSETKFHDFYLAHEDIYADAVNSYKNNVLPYFHEDWYASFYGTVPNDNYWVIISLNNGTHNYGAQRQVADGKRDVINVCGYSAGQDDFGRAEVLIHEFNHSFVNPLLENYSSNSNLMKNAGESLLSFSHLVMKESAYGHWSTVINESIVRAAVISYLMDKGFSLNQIKNEMYSEIGQGFTWMPELVEAFSYYSDHRDKYKTLNDFYPEIAKCLDSYVAKERDKIDQCLPQQNQDPLNPEIGGVIFHFERETTTTLKLASVELNNTTTTTITIPATVEGKQVTIIGERAFTGLIKDGMPVRYYSVIVPEGVITISDFGFADSYVSHVTLPSTLEKIGMGAFSLSHLEDIYIPASVTSIGMRFVNHTNNLTKIVIDENNPVYDSRDNCNAVIETATNTLIYGCKSSTIPKGVTALGDYSFIECDALTSIDIPSWVTSIADVAFWYCGNLKTVYSHIEKPFAVAKDLFVFLPSDATLYVPTGTKEKYESAQGWNVIKNIVEMDMTDIKDVLTSTNEQKSLFYNLQGQRVKNPGRGIYIHNGRKVLIK